MASMTMYLNGIVVESRWFPDHHLTIDGYLQGVKQDLLEQNEDLLANNKTTPEFEVKAIPKKIIVRN
jgi:hypothetical protein